MLQHPFSLYLLATEWDISQCGKLTIIAQLAAVKMIISILLQWQGVKKQCCLLERVTPFGVELLALQIFYMHKIGT